MQLRSDTDAHYSSLILIGSTKQVLADKGQSYASS